MGRITKYKMNKHRDPGFEVIKAPDLNAPRFRYKFRDAMDGDFIKAFRAKYPQYAHYDQRTIKSIIKLQCKKICDHVINNRDGLELQSSLGHLFIGSYKLKASASEIINYAASFKAGTKVLHRNLNTDNHIAKLWYSNMGTKYQLANRQVWIFTGVRQFTRGIAKVYPENWKKYVLIDHNTIMDNKQKISDAFKKHKYVKSREINDAYAMDTYNEFDV